MKPKTYSSEGVVLARRNYGEADRILVIYSKDYGKLALIAKGVRKVKSRKRGHLEIFSKLKFSVAKGRGLDILTEADLLDSFSQIRKDLKKVSVAYFLMETVGRLTREDEKNEEYYSHVLENLRILERAEKLGKFRKEFINQSLVILGFWPKNKKMVDADKVLEEVTERKFSTVRVGKKVLAEN